LEVRLQSAGSTSANKLTIDSKSQYYSGGKWHKYFVWGQNKTTFTANGSPHSIDYSYSHEGTNQHNWRIVSKLRAWNGSHLLASKTIKSLAC
jgi:putative salt-induced outer membrane protein YdiY